MQCNWWHHGLYKHQLEVKMAVMIDCYFSFIWGYCGSDSGSASVLVENEDVSNLWEDGKLLFFSTLALCDIVTIFAVPGPLQSQQVRSCSMWLPKATAKWFLGSIPLVPSLQHQSSVAMSTTFSCIESWYCIVTLAKTDQDPAHKQDQLIRVKVTM